MGYAAKSSLDLRTRLVGLRVAVDVQHLYREGQHAGDHGSTFTLEGGGKIAEAQAAVAYAQALVAWLRARGAAVLTNEPAAGILTGPYSRRNAAALSWGAGAYLACHVNAGGGGYALAEYPLACEGQVLGDLIGAELVKRFREIRAHTTRALSPGARGDVCIEGCSKDAPAIVLEPFFGDTPAMQPLFAAGRLTELGEAIGEAVASWWEKRRK